MKAVSLSSRDVVIENLLPVADAFKTGLLYKLTASLGKQARKADRCGECQSLAARGRD
jgi:hypothetical protein